VRTEGGELANGEQGGRSTIRRSLSHGHGKQLGIYRNEQTLAGNLGRWFHTPALPDAVTGSSISTPID
jgi:hypothetical protein